MYSLVSYEEKDCVCLSLELPGVLVETECNGTEVIKTMISMQFPLFQGLRTLTSILLEATFSKYHERNRIRGTAGQLSV